jgi:hypothetical protein
VQVEDGWAYHISKNQPNRPTDVADINFSVQLGPFLAYFGTFATPAFTHFYRYTPKKCFASSKSSNEESSPRNKPHDTLTPFPCHITPKKA